MLGQTGNLTNLILLDPTGKQYRSGMPVTFTLSSDRGVAVASPMAGTWTLKVEGLNGVAAPETINGKITMQTPSGTTNLNDIAGDPAEAAIKMAVTNRLVDGLATGYKPSQPLTRIQLADYLLMGQGIRQYLPHRWLPHLQRCFFGQRHSAHRVGSGPRCRPPRPVPPVQRRDAAHGSGTFSPNANVDRASLAYSLVQSLGFQKQALARNGKAVTVNYNGAAVAIDDAATIPAGLEGYVSIALELNLINAYFSVTQGPYDLQPVVHATFKPTQAVTPRRVRRHRNPHLPAVQRRYPACCRGSRHCRPPARPL